MFMPHRFLCLALSIQVVAKVEATMIIAAICARFDVALEPSQVRDASHDRAGNFGPSIFRLTGLLTYTIALYITQTLRVGQNTH